VIAVETLKIQRLALRAGMQTMNLRGRTDDGHRESAWIHEGCEERRADHRDESRPLPQPLDHQSISSILLELQPGMSKAVEICYDCWKVHFMVHFMGIV
jgi:hypothetical protein